MESSSLEHGTHNGLNSTNLEEPFSEEFPPNKVMTFAAEASATPTPTKPHNTKKRPNKRLRAPINSPTRRRILRIRRSANKRPSKRLRAPLISPKLLYSNKDKVTPSDATLYSKHFNDYKVKILAEFKSLYRRSKKTKTTYTRILTLNEHDLTPPSLRTKPPNLNIEHVELNINMHNEFITISKQYNKELTRCYIKHLDLLAHSYTKDLDDFPNKVRLDISKIAKVIQEPLYSQSISSNTNSNTFKDTLALWQQNFAIEILQECDDFAMNHTIETAIHTNATKYKDKSLTNTELLEKTHINIIDTSEKLNIREIDIDMSEENDYEDYYNSPSRFTTLDNTSSAKHNSDVAIRPFGPKKIHPNSNQMLKTNPITNTNPTNNTNPNPNHNPKNNTNHKPNPKPLQQKPLRPANRHSLPRFACNIATNEVSKSSIPHFNQNGPRVTFYKPNKLPSHPYTTISARNHPPNVLDPHTSAPYTSCPPPSCPPPTFDMHQSSNHNELRRNQHHPQLDAWPPLHLRPGNDHISGNGNGNHHTYQYHPQLQAWPTLHLRRGNGHTSINGKGNHHTYPFPPSDVKLRTVYDSRPIDLQPPLHGIMHGTAQGSRHGYTPPLLPTPRLYHEENPVSHLHNPNPSVQTAPPSSSSLPLFSLSHSFPYPPPPNPLLLSKYYMDTPSPFLSNSYSTHPPHFEEFHSNLPQFSSIYHSTPPPLSSNFHNALPQLSSNPYPTPTPLISPFHSHYTYHSPPTHPPYSTHNPPTHPPYYTKPPPFRPNTKTPNIYSNTPSHKNYKHYKSTSKPCPTPQPLGDPQPSRPKNV